MGPCGGCRCPCCPGRPSVSVTVLCLDCPPPHLPGPELGLLPSPSPRWHGAGGGPSPRRLRASSSWCSIWVVVRSSLFARVPG